MQQILAAAIAPFAITTVFALWLAIGTAWEEWKERRQLRRLRRLIRENRCRCPVCMTGVEW